MSSNLGLIYSEFNFNVLNSSDKTIYIFENYRLDVSRKMLYRDGEELSLPPKAVETLFALLKKSGEIVNKDDLIGEIWTDTIVEESNLAHYLHLLRKTFGNREDGKPYIETLRRRGYRFNPVGEVVKEFQKTNAEDEKTEEFNAAV
ncbi:MAG TPA: winged helix-turn-helix domain-containing protein, partial [Pyrinomonadaceae bacterium]|nr:winged helix-turn-helix domain-containing protein [Pyrinomonadaceae bacterium]